MATHLAQISALVGFLLPLLIAIVQQAHWPEKTRTVVGLVCITIATTVTAWVEGKLNLHDWATSLITIFTLTQVSYHTVWKKAGTTQKVEKATSPSALAHESGTASGSLLLIIALIIILAALGGLFWSPWAFLLLLVVLLLFFG